MLHVPTVILALFLAGCATVAEKLPQPSTCELEKGQAYQAERERDFYWRHLFEAHRELDRCELIIRRRG